MENSILSGYQPEAFFNWFEQITQIPRGSGREQAIGRFLLDFAAERDLAASADEIGNVFMRIPASAGYEQEPAILVQAHLDMVWAKAEGVDFDFATQPICLQIAGDMLSGRGTNLGSDNGIGIAFMLAVADDPAMAHPPLEYLFTVQEEVGMIGIKNFDLSRITARRMINTDCGYSHGMCVSSVGNVKYMVKRNWPVEKTDGWAGLILGIQGGCGGHGGLMIHKGRACAVNAAGELLHMLKKEMPVRLVSLSAPGGAIHGNSETVAIVPADRLAEAEKTVRGAWDALYRQFADADPDITLSIESTEAGEAVAEEDSARLIDLLYLLPTAALRHDGEDTSFILTSNSIGDIYFRDGELRLQASVRSAINSERDSVFEKLSTVVGLLGFDLERTGGYDSWPARPASIMQAKLAHAHRKLFDREIEREHIHGGIEVSYIMGRYPEMDAVGISPTAEGCHTVHERLHLREVQPFWELMVEFLGMRDEEEAENSSEN